MAYAGIENPDFCGRVECLFAGSSFCSICDSAHGEGGFLKFYEQPITLVETKEEHERKINDLPF